MEIQSSPTSTCEGGSGREIGRRWPRLASIHAEPGAPAAPSDRSPGKDEAGTETEGRSRWS